MFHPVGCKEVTEFCSRNSGQLSKPTCSGRPCGANNYLSAVIVLLEVVIFITRTSGHFEWMLNTTSSIFPMTGPAKSM